MAGKKKSTPDAPPPPATGDTPPASRRRFLQLAGAGALAAGAAGVWYVRTHPGGGVTGEADGGPSADAGASAPQPVPRPETLVTFDPHEYDTLDAIAGVLLPADAQDPGARETGAMIFIDRAMSTPAFSAGARSMKVAVKAVDWQSEQAYAKKFAELGAHEQELVVQAIYQGEADRGSRSFKGRTFLTLMMSLVLEGHLSEPIHGGNRDGMGWKLVAFQPVDPRPGRPAPPGGHHH